MNTKGGSVLPVGHDIWLLCSFIQSFIPLACAEWDDSLRS